MSVVYNHEQGYDVILLDPAKSSLMCSECDLVLRDAVQTMEGTRLCLPCFKKIERSPGYKSSKTGVSILDEYGKPGWYPDMAVRQEIMQLTVKCHNCIFGCPWTGHLLQYFKAHHPECKYNLESCPNEGCKEMILPVNLEKHQTSECMHRIINCPCCNQATKPADLKMDDHNPEDCSTVQCNCEQVSQGNTLAEEAILEDNQKGYDVILVERQEGLQCKECDLVLRDAVQTCEGIRMCRPCYDNIARLPGGTSPKTGVRVLDENGKPFCYPDKAARREVGNLIVACKLGCPWNGPIGTYFEKHREVCPCRPVNCPACNKQVFQGQLEDHECSRYRCFCGETFDKEDTDSIDSHLLKPGVINKHFKKLSSVIAKQDRELKALHCQLNQQNVQSHNQTVHQSTTTTCSQTAVDNVQISENSPRRVAELELQLQASIASTHNGSFMWRIPDILRRRREAIENRITSIYSPPFYGNGYKMCIRAYLNGDGMGYKTHLSLFFVVMKGEFDALLKWPFDYKVSLILVDQNHRKHIAQTFKPTPESNSFQRPVSDMNVASGCPQFLKLSVLDDTSYVKDDVLFVKCIVDTTRIFHP